MLEKLTIANNRGLNMQTMRYGVQNPIATAVVHHGYPSSAACLPVQTMVTALNEAGITVITPDTTHNDNDSDGDYTEMTLSDHIDDLDDCVDHLISAGAIQGPLILAGHSAGAHSALVVSASLLKPPALTLAIAPLISGNQYLEGWESTMEKRRAGNGQTFMKRWQDRQSTPYPGTKLALKWSIMEEWCKHDLIRDAIYPSNPTSVIMAGQDELTPTTETRLFSSAGNISNIFEIEGADHGFSKHADPLKKQITAAIQSCPRLQSARHG